MKMSCKVNLFNYKKLDMCEMLKVIDNSEYVILGVSEDDQPYCIPMCFKYEKCDNKVVFTLYSKPDGMKMQCIEKNTKVCLEFSTRSCNGMKTVNIFGRAKIIKNGLDEMCNDLSMIEVNANEFLGREYYFCNKECQ